MIIKVETKTNHWRYIDVHGNFDVSHHIYVSKKEEGDISEEDAKKIYSEPLKYLTHEMILEQERELFKSTAERLYYLNSKKFTVGFNKHVQDTLEEQGLTLKNYINLKYIGSHKIHLTHDRHTIIPYSIISYQTKGEDGRLHYINIVTNNKVFVMNDQGKTIDKLNSNATKH